MTVDAYKIQPRDEIVLRNEKKFRVLSATIEPIKGVIQLLLSDGAGWLDFLRNGTFSSNGKYKELDIISIEEHGGPRD